MANGHEIRDGSRPQLRGLCKTGQGPTIVVVSQTVLVKLQ